MSDPLYFYKKYFYVQHPIKGSILFEPYWFQEKTLRNYHVQPYNYTSTARQMGSTLMSAAHATWEILFNSDQDIMMVSNKHACAIEMLRKVQFAYEMIPDWMKPEATDFTKTQLILDNGSRISAAVTSENAACGRAPSRIIWDMALWTPINKQVGFIRSIEPSLFYGTKMIVSTSGGGPHISPELFSLIMRPDWEHNFIAWDDHPERDEAFKQDQITLLGEERWRKEYECRW